jgi:alpha-D-xyloside xylohydrolase
MAETLRGGLSLAASGFGYWSHDIGGFEGTPDTGVFKRWLAFGLLSSHSRLHGSGSYRVPWAFDDEAVTITRKFTRLKMSLMPYLAATARQVQQSGTPMLRPMVLEFPQDPATEHVDTQYMLGDSLLVAPVFSADGRVRLYVPDGTWTNLLDGSTVSGPSWVEQTHGFDSVPLLVRPGAVIPFGGRNDRPDYDYADGVTLALFGVEALTAQSVRVPALGGGPGTTFEIDRGGNTITILRTSGADLPWSVRLSAGAQIAEVRGAEIADIPAGSDSTLRAVADRVSITLM